MKNLDLITLKFMLNENDMIAFESVSFNINYNIILIPTFESDKITKFT